jgi:ketosteroid isomerase-like protein
MMKGRTAIQAFWKTAAEQLGDAKLTAVDVKPLGSNAAREIGTFSLRTKGSQPQEMTGKYVVVWEKAGSDWKLATDIWNMNK